jgi:hypothetical protein
MVVKLIAIARYIIVVIGLFVGFFLLFSGKMPEALSVVALTTVGLVGTISFFSHVVFHKEDAKRIGLIAKDPGFQFEVGFANLAFGIVALISYSADWGIIANTVLVLAYAIYLFQAGILHTVKSLFGEKKDIGHFIRSGLLTFIYSGMMIYFVVMAILSNNL